MATSLSSRFQRAIPSGGTGFSEVTAGADRFRPEPAEAKQEEHDPTPPDDIDDRHVACLAGTRGTGIRSERGEHCPAMLRRGALTPAGLFRERAGSRGAPGGGSPDSYPYQERQARHRDGPPVRRGAVRAVAMQAVEAESRLRDQ